MEEQRPKLKCSSSTNNNKPTFTEQYISYIEAVSFSGGRNRNTRIKPPACHVSLTKFIT